MNTILLIIKSSINAKVYKTHHFVDLFLKPFREKYYLGFYVLSSILYAVISLTSIGAAAENPITLSFANYYFTSFNFLQYAVVLILQTLFWKLLVGQQIRLNSDHYNVFKMYYQEPTQRFEVILKMIFFNGSSFRILMTSLLIIPLAIPFYFTEFIVFNILLAYFLLFAIVLFLNSLETLLYFLEQKYKINASVFTVVIFVFGFISLTYFSLLEESSAIPILVLFLSIIFLKLSIDYYVKMKWL